MREILTEWQENYRDQEGSLNNQLFLHHIYDTMILEGISLSSRQQMTNFAFAPDILEINLKEVKHDQDYC